MSEPALIVLGAIMSLGSLVALVIELRWGT